MLQEAQDGSQHIPVLHTTCGAFPKPNPLSTGCSRTRLCCHICNWQILTGARPGAGIPMQMDIPQQFLQDEAPSRRRLDSLLTAEQQDMTPEQQQQKHPAPLETFSSSQGVEWQFFLSLGRARDKILLICPQQHKLWHHRTLCGSWTCRGSAGHDPLFL